MTNARMLGDEHAAPRPVVVPTRRRLDRRFPSLGFTITTPAPWVELIVTSDPGLLDQQRTAARTIASFYASRSNGGLTPTVAGRARYVVPADVVARLAETSDSLWYLAVAYADSSGIGGVPSSATGATGAVTIDASFNRKGNARTVHAMSVLRSLALLVPDGAADDRLDGEDLADAGLRVMAVAGTQSLGGAVDPGGPDRLEGEDGADVSASVPAPAPSPAVPSTPVGSLPAPPPPLLATVPADAATVQAASWSGWGAAGLADDEYEDGWDGWSDRDDGHPAALADEYPDIDWGGVDTDHSPDRYGASPGYHSLDDAATPSASSNGTAPVTAPDRPVAITLPSLVVAPEVQRTIIERTAGGDEGAGYSATVADGPFRGRYGPGHKAYQRFHTGLALGIAEFSQDSGTLGQLLRLMHEREPDQFAAIFGAEAMMLLEMLTAPGPSSEFVEGGRGPRVQPISGVDIWEEPWLSRFRAAGGLPSCRAAQNQLAAELYLAPLLPIAAGFGLTSQRALCLLLDRGISLGDQGAKRWIADTVGPARTHAQRGEALAALGFASVEAFQAAVPGLLNDGEFGPVTHATLTGALRALGTRSPLPVLSPRQMIDEMVARASSETGATRFLRLAADPDLGDVPLSG